jgi:hypothetical protein
LGGDLLLEGKGWKLPHRFAMHLFVFHLYFVFRSRLQLQILLIIFTLSIFVVSNAYQGLVTSFMLKPVHQNFIKSIDELFDSDYQIRKSSFINKIHEDNPRYQLAVENQRVVEKKNSIRHKFANIRRCEFFINRMRFHGDGRSYKGTYQIPEVAYSLRRNLYVTPFHMFFDKFQYLMDLSFEAGLPTQWMNFYYDFYFFVCNKKERQVYIADEKEILDFNAILPFFLILAFGFSFALFALLCEIFYHDFISGLIDFLKSKLQKRKM